MKYLKRTYSVIVIIILIFPNQGALFDLHLEFPDIIQANATTKCVCTTKATPSYITITWWFNDKQITGPGITKHAKRHTDGITTITVLRRQFTVDQNVKKLGCIATDGVKTVNKFRVIYVIATSIMFENAPSVVIISEALKVWCSARSVPDTNFEVLIENDNSFSMVYQQILLPHKTCRMVNSSLPPCYSWDCKPGDDSKKVPYYFYLKIKRVGELDLTQWWCRLAKTTIRSNNLTLTAPSISISSSVPFAILLQPITVICTAAKVTNAVYEIRIVRNKTAFVMFDQTLTSCNVSNYFPSNYTGSCGTHIATSPIKKYSMEIHSVRDADVGYWHCHLEKGVVLKTKFRLMVKHPFVVLSGPELYTVVGEPKIFVCTATQVRDTAYQLYFTYESFNTPVTIFHQEMTKCSVISNRRGSNSSCAKGTNSGATDTKQYNLKIQEYLHNYTGKWSCRLGESNSADYHFYLRNVKLTFGQTRYFVILNRPITLTCVVKKADKTNYNVYLHNAGYAASFMSFVQKRARCSVFTYPPKDYTPSCAGGTDRWSAIIKEYNLLIHEVKATDLSTWSCSVSHFYSNKHKLVLKDPELFIANSQPFVILGQPTNLLCTATKVSEAYYDLRFSNNHNDPLALFLQTKDKCTVSRGIPIGYTASCGGETNASFKKTYAVEIHSVARNDLVVWWCAVRKTYSENITLVSMSPVLNMFSTPPSTILSQHSLLTCMARNVVRMIYTLEFHIVTEVASMASFKQDSGLCVVLYQPKLPYTANCGKGTDKKANVTKSYILDIKRIEKAQLHTWWCSVGETQSDHFDFKQKIPQIHMEHSVYVVVMHHAYTFHCNVKNVSHTIYILNIYTGNLSVSLASVKQEMTTCLVHHKAPTGYSVSCGGGTFDGSSGNKTYILEILKVEDTDLTYWYCGIGRKLSNKYKLHKYHGPVEALHTPASTPHRFTKSALLPLLGCVAIVIITVSATLLYYMKLRQKFYADKI